MASVQPFESTFRSADPIATVCAACNHRNPPAAKFCNECGFPVHLRECPGCEAINDSESSVCYKCHGPLSASWHAMQHADSAANPPTRGPDPPSADAVTRNDLPALKECLACEAVNDPSATLCHRCQAALVDITAEPEQSACEPAPVPSRTTNVERAASAMHPAESPSPEGILSEAPLHYVGVLTARADEAELDEVDTVAHHRARRARQLRWTAAALLVMPSIVAAALYAVGHREVVNRVVDYVRVAVATPIVRAASSMMADTSNAESAPAGATNAGTAAAEREAPSTRDPAAPTSAVEAQPVSPAEDNNSPTPQSSAPESTELATSTQESAPAISR